jgi:cell division protein FtsW (lipid II flippase)
LSFQPGELAKIVLTVFFAGYLVTQRDNLSLAGKRLLGLQLPRARDLGPLLIAWAASVGVLVVERDLGTSLLFFGLFVAMLYLATERVSWIVIGLGLFGAGAVLAWSMFDHVQARVDAWLHPFATSIYDAKFGGSYQLVQGLFGMAYGGLIGRGLGKGRPTIVPYAESDFILASLGEELGLAGVFAILCLYMVLVQRGLRTAIGVRDGFGKLLAAGLAFAIALQCFVVAGGVTRVIPLTGLTMPLLAYGGSSLLSNWILVGLLVRISDSSRRPAPPVAAPEDGQATQFVPMVDGDPA